MAKLIIKYDHLPNKEHDTSKILYQFYTKEDFEKNNHVKLTDKQWSDFIEDKQNDFAENCGAVASDLYAFGSTAYD